MNIYTSKDPKRQGKNVSLALMGLIKHKHFAINTEQDITDKTKSVCLSPC